VCRAAGFGARRGQCDLSGHRPRWQGDLRPRLTVRHHAPTPARRSGNGAMRMLFDDDDVRWLVAILEEEGLAEIEVAQGDVRIRVRAREVRQAGPAAHAVTAPGAAPAHAPTPAVPAGIPLPAPMAGIFYRQPSPDADPFVEEGDRVEAGDVVGLIEAMKLFNEITAPITGVITRIEVESEDRVEADDPLMYIQPAARSS